MAERSLQVVDTNHRPAAVAQPGPRLGLPTPSEMEALKNYGQVAIASGMAPKHIDKWETAVVIMRYGHQLGVDEFTALQNMWVIGGKPSMMASLMHAMILRDHGDDAVHVKVSNAKECTLICKRRNASQTSTITYTIDEANTAGLTTSNATWKKYPADMLFARAISRAGRQVFRDTTMGLYTPEEIGGESAPIEVGGEIIETTSRVIDPQLTPVVETYKATTDQVKEISSLARQLGVTKKSELRDKIGKDLDQLSPDEADATIKEMQDAIEELHAAQDELGDDVIDTDPRELPLIATAGEAGFDKYSS